MSDTSNEDLVAIEQEIGRILEKVERLVADQEAISSRSIRQETLDTAAYNESSQATGGLQDVKRLLMKVQADLKALRD